MITKGTTVRIRAHHSEPGQGLTYAAKLATLADDCPEPPGGWDVIDLTDGSSVYAFSVSRVMNREAFKLARDTLRLAVREYGWHRERTEIGYFAHDHIANTYATEKTVTHVRADYRYGPGKFEGEHWSIVHFYDAVMNGCTDEPLSYADGQTAADLLEVSDLEREAFKLEKDTSFVALWYSDTGFVSMTELTADEYDATREAWERDHGEPDHVPEDDRIVKYTAPSAWASYLINGDDSGLEDGEQAQCDAWLAIIGLGAPVGCDDAGFIHYHDAYGFCPLGADCQTYTFHRESE